MAAVAALLPAIPVLIVLHIKTKCCNGSDLFRQNEAAILNVDAL